MRSGALMVVLAAVVLVGCGARAGEPAAEVARPLPLPPAPAVGTPDPPAPAVTTPAAPATAASAPVLVPYRIEVRTADAATADFPAVVEAALSDPRGWQQAGFRLQRADDAPHIIVIAEAATVDALCLPYDTYGLYSCQNGPVVAINADRWREATPQWTGDLEAYRVMLVNHEVGHLLGQRHTPCPAEGEPAPVMAQQSTNLRGCLPNPWPLPWEIAVAARHDQPIAPAYGQ